jgi:hypothetical protein
MITICYFTSRRNPRVAWFVDSLARWVPPEERGMVELIFIDRLLWALTPEAGNRYWRRGDVFDITDPTWHVESRRELFAGAVADRFAFRHLPVKPCTHQGPFRLTSKDWFCAAVARNTGIIAARGNYFVGVDDLSVLLPTWWPQVKHAASSGYSVAGAYWKQKALVVENGEIKSFEQYPGGRDTRWDHGSDTGIVPWHGGNVYGCSFGMPTDLLVRINGFEELASGEGGEDYCMGIRSERAGADWRYNRNMQSWESEEAHHEEPSLPRERKIVTPDNRPAGYDSYPHVNVAERYYSDHVMLNRLKHERRFTTIAQWTDIRKAREEFQASRRILIPTDPQTDWRDGMPLSQL